MVDVWDQDTWVSLTDLRKALREEIFDAEDPRLEAVLEAQLKSVEDDIQQGYTVEVPF